jgi:hypothetical protein
MTVADEIVMVEAELAGQRYLLGLWLNCPIDTTDLKL